MENTLLKTNFSNAEFSINKNQLQFHKYQCVIKHYVYLATKNCNFSLIHAL